MKEGDILARRYQVLSKLGQGKFATVFQGFNISTKQNIAIKTESRFSPIRLLKNETTVLKYLYDQGCRCCPIVYWYGIHLDTSCIVFSYYTVSLYDYLHIKPLDNEKKKYIMRTCIEMLESIHKHFVIHRDIKPHNFMIRDGELFLIDFGLATFYIGPDGDHIEDVITENLVGTPKYISYNVHCGHLPSRRDDMLSLGYMFLWLENDPSLFTTPSNTLENKDNFPITHILHPTNVYLKDKKSWYLLENLCSKYRLDNVVRKDGVGQGLKSPTTNLVDDHRSSDKFGKTYDETLVEPYDSIYRYLEHCYRISYEGSPLYGELQKLFLDKIEN